MSVKNVKKLELGIELSCHFDRLISKEKTTEKNIQEFINVGGFLEEEALASGDFDVLERVLDYFLEEYSDAALMNGGCESLDNDIWMYFSSEQITKAFEIKYNQLLDKNMLRASTIAIGIVNTGNFEGLRRIFNYNKHVNSEELVVDLEKWVDEEYEGQIKLLREDMKKW